MNIFNNLKVYQQQPRKVIDEPLPIKKESFKEKLAYFFEETMVLWFVGTILLVFGLLWYFFSIQFCGMMLFGILAVIIFGVFAGGFANLSDWFEKKLGETKGMTLGCLGMLLGPIAAVTIIITSMPYWDYESYYEQQVKPTVYYTPYGECYHSTPHCYHIEGHEITSVNEFKAKQKGLRPCSDCY